MQCFYAGICLVHKAYLRRLIRLNQAVSVFPFPIRTKQVKCAAFDDHMKAAHRAGLVNVPLSGF